MIFFFKLLILLFIFIKSISSETISTSAKFAVIMDFDTENILLDKDANAKIYPASMSKLMTLYILFEEISEGSINMESEFIVSEKAWKKGGSKMFVEVGSYVKIKDLLKGIIVQSGNDACIVVAEGISGSEDAFVDLMNSKAKMLGLETTFHRAFDWTPKPVKAIDSSNPFGGLPRTITNQSIFFMLNSV